MLCVRIVIAQQGVEPEAIDAFIMVGQREAEEVRRISSQIQPGMGPSAVLEAKNIEATVHSVVDAIPTECAVNGRQNALAAKGSLFQEPLTADTKAICPIRSRGQGLKGCLRTRNDRLELLANGIGLQAGTHNLAAVQPCQRLAEPFCRMP